MAEINSFLDPKAQKEIDDYIKSLQEIAGQYAKIADNAIKLEKAEQEKLKTKQQAEKTEAQSLKTAQEVEKLNQQKIKTDQQAIAAQEKARKQAEARVKQAEKEKSAYEKLSEAYKKSAKDAKELAAQYGVNSKQAKEAAKQANKYGNELKKIDSSLGQHQRNVGGYFQAIMKGAGVLGLAVGATELFSKAVGVVKDSINTLQSTGDKFNASISGLKEGYYSFTQGLASGTGFNELIQNFKDAVAVGYEYSMLLDDLADKQRQLRIAEADVKAEQLELLKISKDATKSNAERIAAIDKYLQIEDELQIKRVQNAEQAYLAEVGIASDRADLSRSEIQEYLTNYEQYTAIQEKLLAEEEKRNKKLNELKARAQTDPIAAQELQMELMKQFNVVLTDEEKKVLAIIDGQDKLDDQIRDRLVGAYVALKDAETSAAENTMKLSTRRSQLIEENIKATEKASKEKIGIAIDEDEMINKVYAEMFAKQLARQQNARDEENEAKKKSDEEYNDWADKMMAEQDKKNIEAEEKRLKDIEYYNDQKKMLMEQWQTMSIDAINMVFDYGQGVRQRELESIDAYYQTRINAASNAGEDTEAIEREYAKKRGELERKQAESERNQALFNLAVTTAQKALEIKAIASVLLAKTVTAPLAVNAYAQLALLLGMSAAQAAFIASTPLPEIPAYATGTTDSAGTFIAGEKGKEIVIDKKGRAMVTPDKATLFSNMPGSIVIPNRESLQLLANDRMKDPESMRPYLKEIKEAITDNRPIINIFNSSNSRFESRQNKYRR